MSRDQRVPYLVLAMGVAVTAAAALYARSEIDAQARHQSRNYARLAAIVDRLTGHMYSRMQRVDGVLRAGAAMSPGASAPGARPFAIWAQIQDTTADFHSFGPVRFSPKSQQELSEELLGGAAPGTTIHNTMKSAADKTFLVFSVSGTAAAPKRQYVAFAPVRSGDERSNPIGFVYTRLNVDELMLSELARARLVGIRARLYYSVDTAAANLAYDSDPGSTGRPFKSSYREDHTIYIFGIPWALTIDASAESGIAQTLNPVPDVIAAGAILTLLLFAATMARARARALANETEARYDALFNSTPIPMWVYRSDTLMICAVNDAAVAHYGYTRSEFVALHVSDLRPASEVAAAVAYMKELPPTFQQAGTWLHRKKDGTVFTVEISAHGVAFEGQQSVIVAANDISERLSAEAALHTSEERLRQMADHIREAFFVVDLKTRMPLYTSPTWAEIWGRPMSEANDPGIWFNAVHPDDREALMEDHKAIARGESSTTVFRVIRPDGTTRWVRGRVFPVRNEQGEIYRMVGVSEDITELRLIEARFAQAQKIDAIGRLAGGVAHDFNNLLTVILAEAEQLVDAVTPGTRAAASVSEIHLAGERAATLTRQLLAFSRKQLIAPTVFDLSEAVTGMGNMCRRLIGEHIELITRMPAELWNVRADVGQVEQVIANLVVNARDAMPEGGQVTIATSNVTIDDGRAAAMSEVRPGDYVAMTVSDTGVGMTEEVRARLFEPFFTTKEAGKGTGLGLATCYGIVKQSEGHMTIYSEPGLGTTVTVYLPRGWREPAATKTVDHGALTRGDETILVVEDEAAVRRISVLLLRAHGYNVLEADGGVEAARIAESFEGEIHLLLTDVVLPGIGGREIAEQTRIRRPGIRVLFTSGYTDDVILQHRLLHHDVRLLQKPFSRDSLLRTVRDVLDAAAEPPASGDTPGTVGSY